MQKWITCIINVLERTYIHTSLNDFTPPSVPLGYVVTPGGIDSITTTFAACSVIEGTQKIPKIQQTTGINYGRMHEVCWEVP